MCFSGVAAASAMFSPTAYYADGSPLVPPSMALAGWPEPSRPSDFVGVRRRGPWKGGQRFVIDCMTALSILNFSLPQSLLWTPWFAKYWSLRLCLIALVKGAIRLDITRVLHLDEHNDMKIRSLADIQDNERTTYRALTNLLVYSTICAKRRKDQMGREEVWSKRHPWYLEV